MKKSNFYLTTWVLLELCYLIKSTPITKFYQQDLIQYNPGIYYEKINQIRHINKNWKIMTSVDVRSLLGQPLPGKQILTQQYTNCIKNQKLDECFETLGFKIIDDYEKELTSLQDHLQQILSSTPTTHKVNRYNRSPLLGFVGTISRKLFGTMDYNDHEHIKKEIDRLYTDQRQITHLIGNQTHLIQAEINTRKTNYNQNLINVRLAENKLTELTQNANNLSKEVFRIELLQHFTQIGIEIEYSARKYVETGHKLTAAIEEAKHGKLSPLFLNRKQIEYIQTEIDAFRG